MQIEKRYRAVVWGRLEGSGRIRFELDGRPCDTEYAALRCSHVSLQAFMPELPTPMADAEPAAVGAAGAAEQDAWVTVVDVRLHTGRTHQVR